MDNGRIIDEAFTAAFNEANELYRNDRLEECAAKCRELLDDSAAPKYHRMKTLILLGSILSDWDDADDCRLAAENLWSIVRRRHPEGADSTVDGIMAEIRESLDDMYTALEKDAGVAETLAELEDLNIDIDPPGHPSITVDPHAEAKMDMYMYGLEGGSSKH